MPSVPSWKQNFKRLIQSRLMPLGAGTLGFLEGSFIFFPIEPLPIPAMAVRARDAFLIAFFLLVGNVFGSVVINGLGAFIAEPVLDPVIDWLGARAAFETAAADIREDGFKALFLIGITPFPFQLGTSAAGAVGYSFFLFVFAVSISRGLRYGGLAAFVAIFGIKASALIDRYEVEIMLGGIILFFGAGLIAVLY